MTQYNHDINTVHLGIVGYVITKIKCPVLAAFRQLIKTRESAIGR